MRKALSIIPPTRLKPNRRNTLCRAAEPVSVRGTRVIRRPAAAPLVSIALLLDRLTLVGVCAPPRSALSIRPEIDYRVEDQSSSNLAPGGADGS